MSDVATLPTPAPGLIRQFLAWVQDVAFVLFGALAIAIGLGLLAAVPLLGLVALGYLLEAAARVARGGSLLDGLPGVRRCARVGSCVVGTTIVSLPLIIVDSLRQDAALAYPGEPVHRSFHRTTLALLVLTTLHVIGAIARGGLFKNFFWPFNIFALRPGHLVRGAGALRSWVAELRVVHLFSLGARGFVAAAIWLAPPTALLALGRSYPALGLLGGALLIPVLAWLPFLQVRLAAEDRFAAAFDVSEVRARRRRAPFAHALAVFATLALALPLYLLKIERPPQDVRWLPAILFVVAILPTKLLLAKAYRRGGAKERVARLWARALSWHVEAPLIALYVLLLFFTQFIEWHGRFGLFEHHAFLLPATY